MKVSFVIPMYNENELIEKTAHELTALCEGGLPNGIDAYEIVFSNDGSRDGCDDAVRRMAMTDPHIVLAGTPDNHGKGSAVRHGILASSGDVIVCTDCDLAYGTEQPAGLLQDHLAHGCDITVGSRAMHRDGYAGYSFFRLLLSKCYHFTVRILSGCRLSDTQTGLKCYGGDVGRKVFALCEVDGFAFDLEALMIASKLGAKIGEYPVTIERGDEALGRKSRIRFGKDAFRMLRDILRIRRRIRKIK